MPRRTSSTVNSRTTGSKPVRRAKAGSTVGEADADFSSVKPASDSETRSIAPVAPGEEQSATNTPFPVVGIGASAGGLEAFKQLLDHLPIDTGMAFVLVQHLDPTHESILTELLSRSTRMPVSEVRDGMAVVPDHVYVIPRNTNMGIAEGVLRLLPREEARGRHRPIDYFLRTLAEDQIHRAIGVILSGTASDGTLGLEAIKAEGGITFAQDTESAKYDSMPRSAIAAGHVDFILTPEGIAQELARISRHPYVGPPAGTPAVEEAQPTGRNGFRKILALLRKAKGVDFTDYKANTLHRRITRRMVLNKVESKEDYVQYLRDNAPEVEALYQDILINVTSFFRNPETFEVLKERIFPKVLQQRTPDEPIRIWTLGCSTGEEAYSIAMSFVEFAGDRGDHIPVQIFATDLSDKGIDKARAGLYSRDIAEHVSSERLRRFFVEADGGYRISKPIRDMVVFARQNIITDPPFSRLDLISCRNLLIYLEPVLQKRVLPILHYALKSTGMLWLGTSETPGSSSDLFAPEEKKHRFYSKRPASLRLQLRAASADAARRSESAGNTRYVNEQLQGEHDAQKEADRILLARYSPASVLVNAELEILQFRGSTGSYLEAPPGKATLNLLKMAREGLMMPLRAAIQKAKRDDATIRTEGVRVHYDGKFRQVNFEVVPIKGLSGNDRSFLILFEPATLEPGGPETQKVKGMSRRKAEDRKVARLQEELDATREYLQSLVEQQEGTNEELQSSSEEIQSSNEELQSINEELETAKEELESSNEELATLNDELQNRNQELSTLNDDLTNLHVSVNIPILILGRDLRIRRFTPQAEKVLSLIATDVGRPISDIKTTLDVPDLEELILEVIDTITVREREVQDRRGRWYSLRVRPYKTLRNSIDGAVIVLVDIDALKRSEAEIIEARDYAETIIRTTRHPLVILNADLRVHTANEAFYKLFKVSPADSEGRLIYELGNRQWDIPRLRELLEDILPRNSFFNDFEVTHEFEGIGRRTMILNARRLEDTGGRPGRVLLGVEDVTQQLQFQWEMRRSETRYRRLFEAAQDGVLLIDPRNRKILDANPFMAKLLGYTHPELLGKELFEIGLLKDQEASRAAFRELKEKGFIRYENLPLETKTGKRCEVEMVSNLYTESGEEIIQCNIRDITERKESEAALRASEERYRTLFDLGLVAVYLCDASGVIQEFNRRAAELWGRAPAAGENTERFCGSLKMFRPDGTFMPHEQCPMADVVSGRVPSVDDAEVLIERPDGSRVTVVVKIKPLKNERGEITGAMNCFYDITERKKSEDALREAGERFRFTTESMPQKLFTARPNGEADYFNRQWTEFTGLSFEQIKGWGWTQFIHPDDVEENLRVWQHSIDTGDEFQFEHRFRRHDGEYRWHLSRARAMLNSDGKVLMWIGSNTDIDDVKRAEEERELLLTRERQARRAAETANRVRDEFLATLSHELRTPLTAISGWAEMLQRGVLDEQTTARAIEAIGRNAKSQSRLISDLLDVSRAITGKLRFEVGPVDLVPVIEAAAEAVRPAADAKGVELKMALDPRVGLVSGDDSRLQQVVWNLLSNAIKYTQRGGRVEVTLKSLETDAAILVTDTGEGISAGFLPYIFDRFRQADSTTTRQHDGLGLGLAIVRHMVEAHGGTVNAESPGPGHGATFTVTLPLNEDGDQERDLRRANNVIPRFQTPEHTRLRGIRILMVDDDRDARDMLSLVLSLEGAEVRTGSTANEALEIIAQWKPDLLLSDIGMPGEDGYHLIKEIRAREHQQGGVIPAVALTGYAADQDAARAREAGFQMHMTKPVELNKLIVALASLAHRDSGILTPLEEK